MQSPFQIFRKHQKVLIVVLTGLAMFAFILLDSLQNVSRVSPVLLIAIGGLLVGGAFWIVGLQGGKGKQNEYGMTGAVAGVALGLAIMFFSRPKPAVETSVGKITTKDLRDHIERRNLAIRFMRTAFDSTVQMPLQYLLLEGQYQEEVKRFQQLERAVEGRPEFAQFLDQGRMRLAGMRQQLRSLREPWDRQRHNASFGFNPLDLTSGDRATTERDAVLRFLLLKEARELGVQVNNDAVNAYIKRMTNDGMTAKMFNNLKRDLGVETKKLYAVLREEIAAQIVLRLQRPEHMKLVTPGEYWEQYRKLSIRQKLEFVPVDVADFTSEVAKPTPQELKAFFDKYKKKAPTGLLTDEPAFGLPERIQLAYFKADFEDVKGDVLKRLDRDYLLTKEIADALKEIDKAVADVQQQIKDGKIKKELADKELLDARQLDLRKLLTSGQKVKRLDFEVVKHYENHKSTEYQNPAWKAPHPGGERKPDPFKLLDDDDPPAPKSKSKAKTKPAGKSKSAETPLKFPETPAKGKPAKKTSDLRPSAGFDLALAATLLDGPAALLTSFVSQDAKSPAKSAAKKSSPPKTSPKTSTKADPRKPVVARRPEPKKPLIPTLPPPPALPEGPPPLPFRELDDDLRSRIRDDILKQKVQAEIRKRMQQAGAAMEAHRSKYLAWIENPEREFDPKGVSAALRKKADELGLKYQVTEKFGELEFARDSSRFPMNDAREVFDLAETGFRPQQRLVHQVLFPRGDESERQRATNLYSVILGKDTRGGLGVPTEHVFVMWKTAYDGPKTPEFDDKGIQEQVLKTWRQVRARPLAEKRAKELADVVRKQKKPMEDVLKGKTVTDKPDGPPLLPDRTRESFSWLTNQRQAVDDSAPPLGIHQRVFQIAPSQIRGVKKAGDEFRRYVFESLRDGEVGVVPNADKSTYYVVRVLDRQGTTDEGRQHHYQKLLDSQPTAEQSLLYGPLKWVRNPINEQLIEETTQRLYKKYNVKMNRPLDKDRETERAPADE